MSKRDLRVPLWHMRDHAHEAIDFCKGKTRSDLDSDRMLQLSLLYLVQVIGEAAKRVPSMVRAKHSLIPWDQIIGARNILVHRYDEVDLDILWTIVTTDLPDLVGKLDAALSTLEHPQRD